MNLRFIQKLNPNLWAAWVRNQGMAGLNIHFTYFFYVVSALVGSASAVFFGCAAFWAFLRAGLGHFSLSSDARLRIIAALFSLYPLAEFISALANQRGLIGISYALTGLLCLAVLPVTSRLLLSSPADIANAAGRGAAVGGVLTLIFCAIQFQFLGFERPEGGSGNPNVLAFFATALCCLCFSLVSVVSKNARGLLLAGAVCCIFSIVLVETRAAWISIILAIAIAVWPSRAVIWNELRKVNLVLKTLFFAAFALLIAFVILPRVSMTIESINAFNLTSTDISISHRITMWSGGFDQFLASPLFGYGPDSSRAMIGLLNPDNPLAYSHYHNIFLTAAIRGGILEVISLVLIFGGLFWIAFKKPLNRFQSAGQTLLLAFSVATLVQGMTGVLFVHDIVSAVFNYTIIIGLFLTISRQNEPEFDGAG